MLTLLLCLRYGQGTDYFAYKYLYELSSVSLTWNDYLRYLLISHGQIGWQTIMFILNGLHISYEYFVIFLSLLEMLLLNVFINNFCFKNTILMI